MDVNAALGEISCHNDAPNDGRDHQAKSCYNQR
jgi:hypothetical protein